MLRHPSRVSNRGWVQPNDKLLRNIKMVVHRRVHWTTYWRSKGKAVIEQITAIACGRCHAPREVGLTPRRYQQLFLKVNDRSCIFFVSQKNRKTMRRDEATGWGRPQQWLQKKPRIVAVRVDTSVAAVTTYWKIVLRAYLYVCVGVHFRMYPSVCMCVGTTKTHTATFGRWPFAVV